MDIWKRIQKIMKKHEKERFDVLSERTSFLIHSVNENDIIVEFDTGNRMSLESWRFEEAYNNLPDDEWVPVGASKTNTKRYSIEGFMKSRDGNMNGLMTATWVAPILVHCNLAEFNGISRGQKIRKLILHPK